MKKLLLLLSVLLSFTTGYAQQFYMNGRFSNTTPDINALIDSAAFNFTNTHYTYFIDDNPAPSSFGTYEIIIGSLSDTLVLYEDSLGVCSDNGTGTTVKMEIEKTVTPYYSITLSETAQSMDSCSSHSLRMSGQFIATSGVIFNWAASVKNTDNDHNLQAYAMRDKLMVISQYDEKVSVMVTNINGQIVMKKENQAVSKGQPQAFRLGELTPGIYIIRIRSEHGQKMIKTSI